MTAKYSIEPYLIFNGRCEEAIEFYRKALGAEVTMVMHASLRIGETVVLASDGRCTGTQSFDGFSLSLTLKDVATADRFFAALADGGQVQMPQSKTFWSPRFGMVTDRFGVSWMVNVVP
jgi:PhnB protein